MINNVRCPLLDMQETSDDECFETCLVVNGLLKKEAINPKFIQNKDFVEICLNCPYHDKPR
jgi:hypothetical protein